MRKIYSGAAVVMILSALIFIVKLNSGKQAGPQIHSNVYPVKSNAEANEENEEDGMDKAMQLEFELTRDIKLGYVPTQRLLSARESQKARFTKQNNIAMTASAVPGITWTERGPNNIGGRTRAIWYDLNDVSFKKVWAGGIGGGLWVTNDITAANPVWTKQNDAFANIGISCFAQSNSNKQDMYFGTGEGWFNGDFQRGLGIWYSGDGGVTWNQLASTINNSFVFVQKLVIDNAGNVYACTASGLQKSSNKGVSWTSVLSNISANILPLNTSTAHNTAGDIEIAANGNLYCSFGNVLAPGAIYKSVNAGTTWTDITPAISAGRIELACAPSNANIVYALFQSTSTGDCSAIQKFDASSSTWTAGTVPTIIDQGLNSNFTRGQAWYDLIAAVDPNNANSLYIGGVDALRSDDGGLSWTQMSSWSLVNAPGFASAQNVHADHHAIIYQPGSSAIALWATDGGIFRTLDANSTLPTKPSWTSKNSGYNVTQYYSVAIHPTNTNYLIGGTQDNGTHRLTAAGVGAATVLTSGDGGFAHIDQENGNIQMVQVPSTTFNNYIVTADGWATGFQSTFPGGSFINPTDYDDAGKYLYGTYSNSSSASVDYFRWTSPSTNGAFQTFSPAGFPPADAINNNSPVIRSVTVSPITLNRVYFGFNNGTVVRVDNANTSTPVATTIKTAGSPAGNVSCIAIDPANENHIVITFTNYGANSVLETTNALSGSPAWTNDIGNLPDMPIHWAMFDPRNSDWLILATELGVWSTDNLNAGATDWQPTNNGFANARVDMLQYRTSDRLLAAATHGRGIFTTNVPASTLPGISFERGLSSKTESTSGTTGCRNYTDYTVNMLIENAPVGDAIVTLDVQAGNTATQGVDFDFTTNGNFASPSNTVTFTNGSAASKTITIRVYNDAEVEATENFVLEYVLSGATNATRAVAPQTHTFEITDNDVGPVLPFSTTVNLMTQSFFLGDTAGSPPFNAHLSGQRSQMLYKKSELIAAGFSTGQITSFGIYLQKHSTKPYLNLNIGMGTTNVANLIDGAVTTVVPVSNVKSLTTYSTVNGLNSFTLDNPFYWDGNSNLVVEICFDNGAADLSQHSDVSLGSPDGGNGTQANFAWQDNLNCGQVFNPALMDGFGGGYKPAIQLGVIIPGTPIETVLNSTRNEFVSNSGTYNFYNGINIINQLNGSSANLDCVSSSVFEAGNTWQTFSGGLRSQKVIEVIPASNPGASYNISLYFRASELAGKTPGTLRIAKTTAASMTAANAGNTIIAGNTTVTAFDTGYLFTASFTGFSKFFLIDNNVALPVTLLSFDANLNNKNILLNWTTSSEQNSKLFEVQKSADGANFYPIGTLIAAGSSSSERKYQFIDKQLNEFNYYRLKMVDKDGKFVMSKTALVRIADILQNVRLINNPFHSSIDMRLAKLPKEKLYNELVTMDGKRVYSNEAAATTTIRLDFSGTHLSAGTYLLRTRVDGKWYTNKVLKQ